MLCPDQGGYTGSRGGFSIIMASNKHISLPNPLAEGDPANWFLKYEICCTANEWGDEVKAKKLPTLLEGEALAVWLELSTEQQANYETTKAKITKAMVPVQFVSLDDFRARKLQPNEALSAFLHDLRQMLKQAMPGASEDTRKQLLLHQFISGLPISISKQLRATGELNDLDAVTERAKLLMTIEELQKMQLFRPINFKISRSKLHSLQNKLLRYQPSLQDNQQL